MKKGRKITKEFIEGFLMNDEDLVELVNAWVSVDNAIGIIETTEKKPDEFSEIENLIDSIQDDTTAEIFELSSIDENGKADAFIFKSKTDTIAFIAHDNYLLAFWNCLI